MYYVVYVQISTDQSGTFSEDNHFRYIDVASDRYATGVD